MIGGLESGYGVVLRRQHDVSLNPTTFRGQEWAEFAHLALAHVEDYTVKQYGDGPNDPVQDWTLADIKKTLERYVNRMGRGARGLEEEARDMLKIAHYAAIAYTKLPQEAK